MSWDFLFRSGRGYTEYDTHFLSFLALCFYNDGEKSVNKEDIIFIRGFKIALLNQCSPFLLDISFLHLSREVFLAESHLCFDPLKNPKFSLWSHDQ